MKCHFFWGVSVACATLLVLSGCASKSLSVRQSPPSAADSGFSKEFFGEELAKDSNSNPPLTEEEFEAQQRGEVPPRFDFPVTRNAHVEQWISYFQGRGRKWFHLWLERSGRYIPMMRKILQDHDLPEDLVYLAMIESGYSSRAYSRARAVGIWQFIKSTGKLYGLQVNFWMDERRDPEKATLAAARHLKDLYDQFQSWKLAAAAYNAGPRKISRAIKKYKTEEFWELTKGRYLKKETKHYVPKIIAAALIAKDPETYGFTDIKYSEPLQYDKIVLDRPVNLQTVAKRANIDLEELLDINPELNHPVTPPNIKQYELRVPAGQSQGFLEAYNSISDAEKIQFTAHRIRKGDTLSRLARLYSVPSSAILEMNNLRSVKRLKLGDTLIIPVPLNEKLASMDRIDRAIQSEGRPVRNRRVNLSEIVAEVDGVHVVRRGESLHTIARKYRMSINELKKKNELKANRLKVGQRLKISDLSKRAKLFSIFS